MQNEKKYKETKSCGHTIFLFSIIEMINHFYYECKFIYNTKLTKSLKIFFSKLHLFLESSECLSSSQPFQEVNHANF